MSEQNMRDDHWKDRNIAELAWFLCTGRDEPLPRLSDSESLERNREAYLRGFPEILDCLLRALFKDRKDRERSDITDFSRGSILMALNQKPELLRAISPAARSWLLAMPDPAHRRRRRRETPIEKWVEQKWVAFLESKGMRPEDCPDRYHELREEFLRTVLDPERKRRHRSGIRESIICASRQMSRENAERHFLFDKGYENRDLESPERSRYRAAEFFKQERQEIEPLLSEDEESNAQLIDRWARKLWHRIEDNRQNHDGKHYGYLLTPDGRTPSLEALKVSLFDAAVLTLGEK